MRNIWLHKVFWALSALQFSGLHFSGFLSTRIQQLNPQQFLGPSKISGLRDFGVSGFQGSDPRGFQNFLPFQPPTSEFPTYSTLRAHIAQWSPTTTIACDTFTRVHVAFNDFIRSHLSHFSSRPTGMWYISMSPHPFLEKSNGHIFLKSTASIASRTFKWSTGGRKEIWYGIQ